MAAPRGFSSRHLIVLLGIAASAAALLLIATHRWGLGVSFDSVVYIQASHDLSSIPLPAALILPDERLIQVASPVRLIDDPRFRNDCRRVHSAWFVCARRR